MGRPRGGGAKGNPDRFLEIKLSATAVRLTSDEVEYPVAVAELRALAGGRADLLAIAAGRSIGGYLGSPGTHDPRTMRAAAMLVEAGADPHGIVTVVDDVRAAVSRPSSPAW